MKLSRTRLGRDIVAEFIFPRRVTGKVMLIWSGLPSVPAKRSVMEFWARKGYTVFFPRYRGTWESGGQFLRMSPEKDVIDVVNFLARSKKIISLWDEKEYPFLAKEIYLCGVSFGGTAALLAANHPKVKKAIVISPVTDWRVESKIERLSWMKEALRASFGQAYRYKNSDWDKLSRGEFFNPILKTKELPGEKIFIMHAEDDLSVPVRTVKAFVKKIGCTFWLRKRGGHFSLAETTRLRTYRHIKKFLAI